MSNNLSIAVQITADGKIPLPEELQENLGLTPLQEVSLASQGDALIVRRFGGEAAMPDRVASIVQRAKVRAAIMAEELTAAEAWTVYDEAAAALRRNLRDQN